jgi:hypothetical protein
MVPGNYGSTNDLAGVQAWADSPTVVPRRGSNPESSSQSGDERSRPPFLKSAALSCVVPGNYGSTNELAGVQAWADSPYVVPGDNCSTIYLTDS